MSSSASGGTILLVFNPDETERADPGRAVPGAAARRARAGACLLRGDGAPDRCWRERRRRRVGIEADFSWPNGARSIYVRDPAGNSVEFAEPRLWFSP
jgi:catechol 2,3-dioxygenase-like lactoylglutathione lyase family enzyme